MVNLPKPGRILRRFEFRHTNGRNRKLYIQEITESAHSDVIKFLERNYLTGIDDFAKAACSTDLNAKYKYRNYWQNKILPQNLSVACMEEVGNSQLDGDKIVGIHLFEKLKASQVKKECFNTPTLPDMVMKINEMVHSKFDLHKTYYVDEYLKGVGVSLLNSENDELNILEEMIKASEDICKANNLKVCAIDSTSTTYISSAQRAGFRCLALIEKDEIENSLKCKFSDNTQRIRVMTKFFR